jgi:hypothetical protein
MRRRRRRRRRKKNPYKNSVGKPEGKRLLEKRRRR